MSGSLHAFVFSVLSALGLAQPDAAVYQGYGEGEYVLVAPQIGGTLQAVTVARGAVVHKGDPLFTLDHSFEQAVVDETRAAADFTDTTYARDLKQIKMKAISQATLDADKATLDQAHARLAQAMWKLDQKTLTAPADALVFDTIYRSGEYINAGQAVVSLLPAANIRARFFVPGTALPSLKAGMPVKIIETGNDDPIAAHITFIAPQAEYTPPTLYNRDNRAKLLYMLEATPDATPERIHPGQPVDVSVEVP